jgi:hypothetical protein
MLSRLSPRVVSLHMSLACCGLLAMLLWGSSTLLAFPAIEMTRAPQVPSQAPPGSQAVAHDIRRYDLDANSLRLRMTLPYMPGSGPRANAQEI